MHLVKRTCTEIPANGQDNYISVGPRSLSAYQNQPAYVLLGDPGAGKTTAFKQAANREDTLYVTARDLNTFKDRPEWHDKILFIDGLDEIRAGSHDARTPFDTIRARLEQLGHPRFRLSCREADWFGASDKERLKSVSPDGQITILHIDPLSEADISEILNHNSQVQSAEEFMQRAKQRGLNELLTNPQILNMLVKAVSDGKWPDTRKLTFEMACQTIVREHNNDHIGATRSQSIDVNQQLNTAGYLCAVQLIAGNAGYALSADVANSDFPELNNPAFENIQQLNNVAKTKLFKAPIEGQIVPVHRHVAEYLAARYLAESIEHQGLPVGRILALISGEDGVVVTELRGLSAWLAALCKSQRSAIIEPDPLGVVLYGDVQGFTSQEKRRVLDGLQAEATRYPWFRSSHWTASPFGALATPDMEQEFLNILSDPGRSDTHQALTECVLDALAHGTKFPQLDDILLNIVCDATWSSHIRRAALKAIQRNGEGNPGTATQLKRLVTDINNGTIADPEDDLLGNLLTPLYPQSISAAEVLGYFHAPKRLNYHGSYLAFWHHKLLDQSTDTHVSVLLDKLAERADIMQQTLSDYHFHDLTIGLLIRGLKAYGESINMERLYEWLGVGLDKDGWNHIAEMALSSDIRSWLEAHPELQKAVIGIGLNRCTEFQHVGHCMVKIKQRLYHASPPADYGQWCLLQMQTTINGSVSHYLLREAVSTLFDQRGNTGLTLEIIEEAAAQESKYNTWLSEMLVCSLNPEEREFVQKSHLRRATRRKEEQGWLDYVRSSQIELRAGQAYPNLLHNLAAAYFGHLHIGGNSPLERLLSFLDHDENLVQSACKGLGHTLDRDDIPSVADIIQLHIENQIHLLSWPYLAGLEEITRASPHSINQLNDKQIRQAIAFYLTNGAGEDPLWYKSLLASRPDLVAEVMKAHATAALRANKRLTKGLYELANNDTYKQVARLVSLPLLKSFPARSTNQQLPELDELLKAAMCYADKQELLVLNEEKRNLRSMNVAQRVHWLAAGLTLAPEQYLEPLTNFIDGQEKRVQHLAGFFADQLDQRSPLDDLPILALDLLIRLIGKHFSPYLLQGTGWVSPARNAADLISRLISCLGAQPAKEATNMLEALLANSNLHRWQTALQRAQFEQRAARREACFRHPDIRQVSYTLKNQSPANTGDLAALTTDVLQEMAHRIRNGNTDDYRQFWNEGTLRKLDTPKHEDACRDALLSDLQQRLAPFGIDAQPEGHYADGKRADIRVAFGGIDGFEVPIEIKKNSHRNLWRAMHDQLIAQYTRDPRAHGFGIYLVFWFGADQTQPPPSGSRPRTPDELKQRLQGLLSVDESRKISICIIDVARPK